MAILNPTFIFGILVLLYLCSFILFAVLRILTGISIQRIGYFSLRRLAYTPKDGIKIEIRGLGINLHRPTFAQPTWLSVVLTELAVTVDLKALDGDKTSSESDGVNGHAEGADGPHCDFQPGSPEKPSLPRRRSASPERSKSWERLNKLKERIKRLHRKINWIRMVDVVATNTSVTIQDVGALQIGSYTMAVDTRRKMVDRGRMFSHKKRNKLSQRPAEWMMTLRSVLFTPEGSESLEVLDHATLNIHGLLYKELDGLRDAAIALKLGRVHIPFDDINTCFNRYKGCGKFFGNLEEHRDSRDTSVTDIIVELDKSDSQEDRLAQTVSDSKEFVSSILRGIKEVQFAVSYVGVTKRLHTYQPSTSPMYLNASMKEVGVDLHRLDPKSPAHRMYFSSKDIAHQALVAALSIAIGVDDGQGKSDRLVYIPMATTTVRTTLPSKTVEFAEERSADERNANILFANIVITSPSVDLDPRHLPLVLALMQPQPKVKSKSVDGRQAIFSRLLPKANVKFSMHEPVVRIALPPVEKSADDDDFDLIISSISSVSLDVESSHSAVGELHYSLASTFRVQSHDLYYQTSSAARFQLLQTETMELKVQVSARPEVHVVASGSLQTFSIHMVRPEISDGVRQIVRQLRTDVVPEKKARPTTSKDPNFLRAIPPWLLHFQFQASDFSAEVAGLDGEISDDTRGVALQLESWTAEYRAQRLDVMERKISRRRTGSRSLTPDTELLQSLPQSPRKKQQHTGDGRRLAIHVRGLEGFVVESAEKWEAEAFLAMPRFEIALSTSSDNQGPIFHFNSHIKTLLIQYSLYRHYAIGVATMVLRKAFVRTQADKNEAAKAWEMAKKLGSRSHLSTPSPLGELGLPSAADVPSIAKELITVDLKVTLVQVKAHMPADPALLLQIYGMETGRHRWSAPFFHAKLARLYAEAPKMKRVWARIVSIKTARVDLRENRRKMSTGGYENEKTIDVNTEAIRLAVPHQLVLHKVFDNIVNTLKATEQLHHRFKTGTNEYILEKQPEGPKQVPKISLRSRALLFELEDGAFEWKLGTIYRAGLIEQQQRLAREEAFRVKAKKISDEELKRESSRYRNRSAHPRGRSNNHGNSRHQSKSDEETSRTRGRSRSHAWRRRMRYDPDGMCGLSGSAKISIKEAQQKMLYYNAQSWKRRIDQSYSAQKSGMKDIRGVFWGPDQLPDDMEDMENILEVPQRPALLSTLISDLHITIGKPTFPLSQLPEFLHRIGKGMPYDMKYTLLIPMHVQIDMGEARMTLRDYPLPLLHVPALKPGQSARLPSWSLKTDFVIAEEFRGSQSMRHVKVDIIPPKNTRPNTTNEGLFAIDVRRTVSPVKTYSDVNIEINTGFPTRITWGASYQPAIQDMMMVIEGFTKPQIDPSDRTGFWDKIRLSFHSRVLVAWKGDGDVHLMLKGTRDPYAVTGNGAGFLMCWRNDVRWSIWRDNEPRKFMTVDSGDYILAIPDYSHQARSNDNKSVRDDDSMTSADSFKQGAIFKKVVMKLSGNVQWLAGLVFEKNLTTGERSFAFEPHYNVILREPSFAKSPPGEVYDAFRGFRSHHIHLSIAVKAPVDRDWSVTNSSSSRSYNTVHLTPRFFTHFFAWWSMFGGPMSLPIRQGRLWPGIEKSSKKFGRHLATIKYNLLLAPLFLSHIYKHKEAEDYTEDVVSATGLKIRLDSFMLDMHQRREEFFTQDRGRMTQTKTSGMKIHKAQLDLLSADIRAVSASIAGTTPEGLQKATASTLVTQHETGVTDLSKFTIPDNDFSWIDMDDFVELDWILPSEATPDTKIMPLAYAPRFTYFRQTDHGDTIAGDPDRRSPFGNEPTHFCIMSQDDDPRRVQCHLIQERLDQLEQQKADHKRILGEAELRSIKDDGTDSSVRTEFEQLRGYEDLLRDKQLFLESMMRRMTVQTQTGNLDAFQEKDANGSINGQKPSERNTPPQADDMGTAPTAEFVSDFNNRFVIHNMQMKWNNSLRNTILRYIHQVSQRRGFVYYLSRRAVKFILDIVEEQHKAKAPKQDSPTQPLSPSAGTSPTVPDEDNPDQDIEQRIREILADGKEFVNADDPGIEEDIVKVSEEHLSSNIGEDFTPQNSYHLRLIAPQIQLQSEKNPKSVVLVTAKGMELKVVEVMDKDRIFDEVSGLVQRRFSVEMDSTQFFVTHQKRFSAQLLSMYSGSHYGTPAGSSWPPWVPMEVMFDFEVDPFGFKRVVQKTSASLRYDKYNTLRLKYNDEVGGDGKHASAPENIESRMDHLWVEFPHVRAICDSAQYYAMYIIVLDLLLYNEPLEKTRTERLEKIMLASDFSDLRGAPEMVVRLQERIRQLAEIKTQFQIHSKFLDKKGWEDRISLEQDLASCEDELFFMMKAITTSQRKYDGSQNIGTLRWNIAADQIVWHLMRDKDQPLVEFQLQNAEYDRTDNSDGSHSNQMRIGKIVGLNLLPDAIYPEMFASYVDVERGGAFNKSTNQQMLRVYWYMLEAIAGIPVMDHFEINLIPMKIQLEREVGKKLFEYIFPGSGDKIAESSKTHSPFQVSQLQSVQDEEDEEESLSTKNSSFLSMADAERHDASTTRAGSLELRLRPTMNSETRPQTGKTKNTTMYSSHTDSSHFRLFQSNKSQAGSRPPSVKALSKKPSLDSLRSNNTGRPLLGRSSTSHSNLDMGSAHHEGKTKRFTLHRTAKTQDSEKPSDDLTKMMTRASNYMTLAYVKIPSVVLCLSYKGKGDRNLEDVHDFVFRMPMVEYRNKTWSNLDLALALKKDVIKALISHTGAIIGNKFSKHRPNTAQQTRLRELATSSTVLTPSSQDSSHDNSDASSTYGTSPSDARSRSPRRSFASNGSGLVRTNSATSSINSIHSRGRPGIPASMMMTPAAPQSRNRSNNDSERMSINVDSIEGKLATSDGGHGARSGSFMSNPLGRRLGAIGGKIRDKAADSSSLITLSAEESEDSNRRKSKLLLGKKILGGLADH